MQPIRIVVAQMPTLLREIMVSSLSRQEGLEVVDATGEGVDLSRLLDETSCQVLILSCGGAELSPHEEQLLQAQPGLRILALDAEGRRAALYQPASRSSSRKRYLGEASMTGLIAAIRTSIASREAEN